MEPAIGVSLPVSVKRRPEIVPFPALSHVEQMSVDREADRDLPAGRAGAVSFTPRDVFRNALTVLLPGFTAKISLPFRVVWTSLTVPMIGQLGPQPIADWSLPLPPVASAARCFSLPLS